MVNRITLVIDQSDRLYQLMRIFLLSVTNNYNLYFTTSYKTEQKDHVIASVRYIV
jgi:hypothetical protein